VKSPDGLICGPVGCSFNQPSDRAAAEKVRFINSVVARQPKVKPVVYAVVLLSLYRGTESLTGSSPRSAGIVSGDKLSKQVKAKSLPSFVSSKPEFVRVRPAKPLEHRLGAGHRRESFSKSSKRPGLRAAGLTSRLQRKPFAVLTLGQSGLSGRTWLHAGRI